MIRDLKAFYVMIEDNKVICFDTNLSKFSDAILAIDPTAPKYQSLVKLFKKDAYFSLALSGKEYWMQKVI